MRKDNLAALKMQVESMTSTVIEAYDHEYVLQSQCAPDVATRLKLSEVCKGTSRWMQRDAGYIKGIEKLIAFVEEYEALSDAALAKDLRDMLLNRVETLHDDPSPAQVHELKGWTMAASHFMRA